MASKNEQEPTHDRDLDLLMVGKSGHGRTTTGNSILGRRQFTASMDAGSEHYKVGGTRMDDRDIKIVDSLGLYHPSCESKEASVNHFIQAVTDSFSHFPHGFHALLLVLSYTARMTDEEKGVIKALKSILGEDVIRNHTVCVLTHRDSFLNDHEDDADFQAWCQDHQVYKDLFEECESRFVLFDNTTRNTDEKKSQLTELISKIDSLKDKHPRYTVTSFDEAEKTREELMMELRLPLILESISNEIVVIKKDLEPITGGLEQLGFLKGRVIDLERKVPDGAHQKITELRKEIKDVFALIDVYENLFGDQERQRLEREKIEEDMEINKREIEEMKRGQEELELEQSEEMERKYQKLQTVEKEEMGDSWMDYAMTKMTNCVLL